jgi:hypothetical protein
MRRLYEDETLDYLFSDHFSSIEDIEDESHSKTTVHKYKTSTRPRYWTLYRDILTSEIILGRRINSGRYIILKNGIKAQYTKKVMRKRYKYIRGMSHPEYKIISRKLSKHHWPEDETKLHERGEELKAESRGEIKLTPYEEYFIRYMEASNRSWVVGRKHAPEM